MNKCLIDLGFLSPGGSVFSEAVLGGLTAGLLTVIATLLGFYHQRKHFKQKKNNLTENLLKAIHSEIKSIWNGYYENIGQKIEKLNDDIPFLIHYPMAKNFFTIYDGNSSSIGALADSNLRDMIIRTYVTSKCMIDLLHRNNDLLSQYNKAKEIGNSDNEFRELVAHAKLLKQNHADTKKSILELEKRLGKIDDD